MQSNKLRVLPTGGPTCRDATTFSRSAKIVEAPNPNRRFSKRNISGSNVSTVFNNEIPPPSPGRSGRGRSASPSNFDPFDSSRPDHVNNVSRQGVRCTQLDVIQQEKAKKKELTHRPVRKVVEGKGNGQRSEPAAKDPIVSVFGLTSSGGKRNVDGQAVNNQTKVPETAPPPPNFAGSSRFRCSPSRREGQSPCRPETMPDNNPQHKNQRFAASPQRRHESLVGVLAPAPKAAPPPAYKLRTPWCTD